MGLEVNGIRFLLYAKKHGVSFAQTAMLGRQGLHLDPVSLKAALCEFGLFPENAEVERLLNQRGGYSEPFLEMLGAAEVCSFDTSEYEEATYLHDFNMPMDDRFKQRFTAVFDGGALEHIFNFPVAIMNCMEMVKVGGHFLAKTPTNNFVGHGFYQFSPELFFRIFCPANGFEIEHIFLYEEMANPFRAPWWEVTDPATLQRRVTLVNTRATSLLVLARRTANTPVFAASPQQSDYVPLWKSRATLPVSLLPKTFAQTKKHIPNPLKEAYRFLLRGYRHLYPRYDHDGFKSAER